MKFGVSSYSFIRLVQQGRMKQSEVVYQAKQMGFDYIEFAVLLREDGQSERALAEELRNECEKHGLPALLYAFGADFLNGTDGVPAGDQMRYVKEQIDLAAVMGCTMVRHDIAYGPPAGAYLKSFSVYVPKLADCITEVTEYARDKGIRTLVENHGLFAQDSDRLEQLVVAVNHDNFGLLVDIGNFACVGEDSAVATGRLAPYALHTHAKDFCIKPADADPGQGWIDAGPRGRNYLKGTIIGHGDIPVVNCLKALRHAGYQGDISIEFEGMEDSVTAVEIGLENLKRYAAKAGF